MERKPETPQGSTLHMIEPALFAKVRTAFKRRGMYTMSLVSMVRTALAEWLQAENGKPKN
jgi:tRNA(Leu) C34 or U34 (ribose-2'-O)-methylase TrmL